MIFLKKISFWAKKHKWPARILILLSFILLTALGVITGRLLRDIQVILPFTAILFIAVLNVAGVLHYPRKKSDGSRQNGSYPYRKQKACDMILASSFFLVAVFLGNHPGHLFNYSSPFTRATAAFPLSLKDSSHHTIKSLTAFSVSMKNADGKLLKWKVRKKLLKEQVRSIRHSKEPSAAGKAVLILLSVIIALGIIGGAGALACNISCNGGPAALAWIVLICGAALGIFILVILIRGIIGNRKKRIYNPEPAPPGN